MTPSPAPPFATFNPSLPDEVQPSTPGSPVVALPLLVPTRAYGDATLNAASTAFVAAALAALPASGTGNVVGPASAISNRIVTFDGSTGQLVKDSGAEYDTGNGMRIESGRYYQISTDITLEAASSGKARFSKDGNFGSSDFVLLLDTTGGDVAIQGSSGLIGFYRSNLTTLVPIICGGITLGDASDIGVNSTVGTKIGTANSQKLGFWNATPVIQPASANQAALTDSTTGSTAATALVDVGVVFSQSAINNNFARVAKLLNQLRADAVASGLIKGSA